MSAAGRILVVEDDADIRQLLRTSLEAEGFDVVTAVSGAEALAIATHGRCELIVLDLGLPDMDGARIIRQVREGAATPILVLSARTSEQQKVDALDAGADDYLTKPFGMRELLARVRVALRHRRGGAAVERIELPGLAIDLAHRRVLREGADVHLTPTEYRLLALLARHAGSVVTHRQLLAEVWGAEFVEHTHYLRIYMGQLRGKLERDPADPRYLLTEPGVGYRLAGE